MGFVVRFNCCRANRVPGNHTAAIGWWRKSKSIELRQQGLIKILYMAPLFVHGMQRRAPSKKRLANIAAANFNLLIFCWKFILAAGFQTANMTPAAGMNQAQKYPI
jgi:hypothetical protein